MQTRYYIDPKSDIRIMVRASDNELMRSTMERVSHITNKLVRVDFIGYWLAKLGYMGLAVKFEVKDAG